MRYMKEYDVNPYDAKSTEKGFRFVDNGWLVDVTHGLGGYNALNGEREPRGVRIRLNPAEITDNGMLVVTYGPGSFSLCVLPLERRSYKQIVRVAEAIDTHASGLCRLAAHVGKRTTARYLIWALKQGGLLPHYQMPSDEEIGAIIAADVTMQLHPSSSRSFSMGCLTTRC